MGIHDGHRKRVKELFVDNGLDSFSDVNVLEFLLFFSVPRKDTNEIAHRLLAHYGSLHEVFNASFYELMEIEGVNYSSAVLITFISHLNRRIEISKTSSIEKINNAEDAGKYFMARFKNQQHESMRMLCLDAKRNIICCREIAEGSVCSANVNIRKAVETAVSCRAMAVIISHNHPGGTLHPSAEDNSLTCKLYKALNYVGIKLEDHIIVSDDTYVSFERAGAMRLVFL